MPRVKRSASLIALAIAAATLFSGCSLVAPASTKQAVTGLGACALGSTWNLDIAKLADVVKAELVRQSVAVTTVVGDGTQRFTWNTDGSVLLITDYTLKVTATPAAGQVITVKNAHSGRSTGVAFINSTVAIPRNRDATGLGVTTTAELNGAALDPAPFAVPGTDLDDAVGIELTCDGTTMTTRPRGGTIIQTWSKG